MPWPFWPAAHAEIRTGQCSSELVSILHWDLKGLIPLQRGAEPYTFSVQQPPMCPSRRGKVIAGRAGD